MNLSDVANERLQVGMQLYDQSGQRLYVTGQERQRFLAAAREQDETTQLFCEVLCLTGCRISEALNLTAAHIDVSAGVIVFESLKKRVRGKFRAVPAPGALLRRLQTHAADSTGRLWCFKRKAGWQRVKAVMARAGLPANAPFATPKGLRHGFGIAAIQAGVPLNLVQKWLGHAHIATTAIYVNALGPEEQAIAARMW